jgi:hypothetical protein
MTGPFLSELLSVMIFSCRTLLQALLVDSWLTDLSLTTRQATRPIGPIEAFGFGREKLGQGFCIHP